MADWLKEWLVGFPFRLTAANIPWTLKQLYWAKCFPESKWGQKQKITSIRLN